MQCIRYLHKVFKVERNPSRSIISIPVSKCTNPRPVGGPELEAVRYKCLITYFISERPLQASGHLLKWLCGLYCSTNIGIKTEIAS